jgi:DNA-binding transcriptional LysR family regulator
MRRALNLRQIEAFKAVIENGTISRAAELVNISQPAVSKLIANLELDSGLTLFDRKKGRLLPTEHAMRLHEEISRIFAGVRQVENAMDVIRREEQGRVSVGVMPALAGSFIQRTTMEFLKNRSTVFCSVQSLSSQLIVEWLVTKKLDVGIIEPGLNNPYLVIEPLMEHALVCIMPLDHPLTDKDQIEPQDLDQVPFISLNPDNYFAHRLDVMFQGYGVQPQIVLVANIMPTLCQFVAAGLGVSLVHPLVLSGLEHKVAVRRFVPDILFNFQVGRSADNRNAQLVDAFVEELRTTVDQISSSILSAS